MRTIACVVFDLDDTLYLERDYVRSGFAAVGREVRWRLGIPGFASVAWREFCRGRRGDVFDRALEHFGVPAERKLVRDLVEIYRNHDPAIALEPDALSCLEALRGRVALAVVTDGPLVSQRAKVRALDIDRYVDEVVYTAMLGAGFEKPHPRAFELVQQHLGCRGRACLYAADNPAKDFGAPRALGWRTYRCRRPLGLHAAVASDGPIDVEASNLSKLAQLVAMPSEEAAP